MKHLKTALMVSAICFMPLTAEADMWMKDKGASSETYMHRTSTQGTLTLPETHVAELQRALADRGYYQGRIDGLWGPQTDRAVRRYEAANGMSTDGVLTTTDLRGLGVNVSYYDTQDDGGLYRDKDNTITRFFDRLMFWRDREDASEYSEMAPAAGGAEMDYRTDSNYTTTTVTRKVDIRKHGPSPYGRGWQQFQE